MARRKETWGPHRAEHRTEDVALAVWNVDERLATKDGAWPCRGRPRHERNVGFGRSPLGRPEELHNVVHVEPHFVPR